MSRRPPRSPLFPYTPLCRSPANSENRLLVVHPLNEFEIWRGGDAETTRRAMAPTAAPDEWVRSEEHTSELQSRQYLVCRLLLEKKKIFCLKNKKIHA